MLKEKMFQRKGIWELFNYDRRKTMDPKLKSKHKLKSYSDQKISIKKNKKTIIFANKTIKYSFSKN